MKEPAKQNMPMHRHQRGFVAEHAHSRLKTLRALSRYLLAEKAMLIGLTAVVTVGVLANVTAPVLQSYAVDAIATGDFETLRRTLPVMILLYAFFAVLVAFQGRFGAYLSQRVIKKLRADLFAHLNGLSIRYLDTHAHGDLISRMTNDADTLAQVLSSSLSAFFAGALTIAGSLAFMLYLSVPLTLAALTGALLSLLVTRYMARMTRKYFTARQSLLGAVSASVTENINALTTVIAYGRQKEVGADFRQKADALLRVGLRAEIVTSSMGPLMNAINNVSFIIVTIFGAYLAIRGSITVGIISAFLVYIRHFARPITEIAQLYGQVETAIAGAERIFTLMAEPLEDGRGRALGPVTGALSFRGVSFAYQKDTPVLRDFTLDIPAGKTVALVGATGSGKTTVINLLMRFYDYDRGSICLDGTDIREYSRSALRKSIGIVLQDTLLFAGTIRENIAYGRPDATDDEIRRAAELASCDAFIRRLPDGYDTRITADDAMLSVGECQLIAIARACLVSPRILILDEATSSVDTRTEKQIQEAMARLMSGRTCLIIAHRLSTITEASEIIVMDSGRIVERGTHRTLLEQKGRYYALYHLQMQGTEI